MPRSIKACASQLQTLKLAIQRNGYRSQRALAEEVGLSLATVTKFLAGKPVDFCSFDLLSKALGFDFKEISAFEGEDQMAGLSGSGSGDVHRYVGSSPWPSGPVPIDSGSYIERPQMKDLIDAQLQNAGTLTTIVAEKGMGKTSLLLRYIACAEDKGCAVACIDVGLADRCHLNDMGLFLT